MSDTNENQTKNEETQEPSAVRDDNVIEVDSPLVENILSHRDTAKQLEVYLSSIIIQHEKTKRDILNRISIAEESLYSDAYALKREMNISEDVTYELKLPESEGEKAYFIKKEEQVADYLLKREIIKSHSQKQGERKHVQYE